MTAPAPLDRTMRAATSGGAVVVELGVNASAAPVAARRSKPLVLGAPYELVEVDIVSSTADETEAVITMSRWPAALGPAPLLRPDAIEACLRLAPNPTERDGSYVRMHARKLLSGCRSASVMAAVPERFAARVVRHAPAMAEHDVVRLTIELSEPTSGAVPGELLARLDDVRCTLLVPDPKAVQAALRELLRAVGPEGIAAVDEDMDLMQAGLSSLPILEFVRSVEKAFDVRIPTTRVFASGQLSIRDVTTWVVSADFTPPTSAVPAAPAVRRNEGRDDERPRPRRTATELRYGEVFGGDGITTHLWQLPSGLALEVAERGSGPALVLLPPYGCEVPVWAPVMAQFADRRVVVVNPPGLGRSPFLPELTTIDSLAHAVLDILEVMHAEDPSFRVDLVGWSFGGFVAQVAAAAAPERIRCLTLVNTASDFAHSGGADEDAARTRQLEDDLRRDLADRGIVDEQTAAAAERLVTWGQEGRPAKVFLHYAGLCRDFRFIDAERIRCPAIVVAGETDLVIPRESSLRTQRELRSAALKVVPGVGHFVPLLRPVEFARHVMETVERATGRPLPTH